MLGIAAGLWDLNHLARQVGSLPGQFLDAGK